MVRSGRIDHPALLEPLTSREAAILSLMVDGLSNREIGMQRYLTEGTVRWYNLRIFSKMGVKSRAAAIAKAHALGLFRKPIILPPGETPTNLRKQPTNFIGREQELQTIIKRITAANCRLLTLTGAGGIGKTRLAHEAAWQLLSDSDFPDGVFFVGLEPILLPEQVIPEIAKACQLGTLDGGDVRQQLLDYLHKKRMLLVLDNFEHLLAAKTDVLAILEHTLHTKIMITARESLHIYGEGVQPITGMNFPNGSAVQEYEQFDSVKLFMDCAARKGFSLRSDDNLPHIADICRSIWGMPLAIELVASWLHTFNCEEICQKLREDKDSILSDAMDELPERQQSIRRVFEHSWKLLNEHEQKILRASGIFWGSFTSAALEGVVGASLKKLAALIDKSSFVQVTGRGRYELHPLIAQYLHEYLQKSEDFLAVSAAHAAYYAEFMRARLPQLMGGERQLAALNEIQADFENVSAAWTWVIDHQDYENIEKMWETLLLYISFFRIVTPLFNHARKITHAAEQPHRLQPYLLCGMDDTTEGDVQRALAIAEQFQDQRARAFVLYRLAVVFQNRYENATAIHWYAESLSVFRQLGEDYYVADTLNSMVENYEAVGDYRKATTAAEECYRICHAIGDYIGLGRSLHSMASSSLYQGDYAASEQYIGESQVICREIRDPVGLLFATQFLGHFRLFAGDYEGARLHYLAALNIADDIGGVWSQLFALLRGALANGEGDYRSADGFFNETRALHLGPYFLLFLNWWQSVAKCGLNRFEQAQEYIGAALEFVLKTNNVGMMPMCLPSAALILWHKQQKTLAVEVMALWFTHPKSLRGWFVKSPLGAQVVEDMKADLGETAFEEAWQRGAARDLHDTVAALLALFSEPESVIQE